MFFYVKFIIRNDAKIAVATDSTRFDLKYATIPANAIPTKVGSIIELSAVIIPLMIKIVRDVYGINCRNLLRL